MSNFMADNSLNEKDSLQDMLNVEKQIVKMYTTAITEGVSKGFRTKIKENLMDSISDQMDVFLQMTNLGYYKVQSAPEDATKEQKEKFNSVAKNLN